MLVLGLQEFIYQSGGGVETDLLPQLAGQYTERDSGMGLAGAHVADQHDILIFRQVFSLGQFQHTSLVDRLDDGEIELVQGSDVRETGLSDETLAGVLFPLGYLRFEQAQQEVLVGTVIPGGFLGQLLVLAPHGGQPETPQLVLDEHVFRH
jgi:hypothetical protein